MALPTRFVVTTYNIWAENRWPEREQPLRAYLKRFAPDILALQELRQSTRSVIDEELSGHRRVDDEFEGWTREGNIYWLDSMFELVEYGAEKLTITSEFRRLFWVRLRFREGGPTLLVSTAHYTFQGNAEERATGQSPRIVQAKETLEHLERISRPGEAVIFMGDLNDANNALRILREGGLHDSYQTLGTLPVITHPALPTAHTRTAQILDWQLHRGPLRVMSNEVADFFLEDLAPSDHKPLTVTYALETE